MASGFDLSFVELDLVGEALGLDVRPFPFKIPWHGELVDDRIRLAGQVHDDLTQRGLIDGPVFVDRLRRLVGLFAAGRVSAAMLGTADGNSYLARAAVDGRSGVLAVQHRESVRFRSIDSDTLPRRLLSLLPPLPAGPGSSVTIITGAAAANAADDPDDLAYLRDNRPGPATDAGWAVAAELLRRPRLGSGYFVVTARDDSGREGEPRTLNWLDTDLGRYAVIPSTGPDGRTHVTYAPADLPRLDQHLTRLLYAIAPG